MLDYSFIASNGHQTSVIFQVLTKPILCTPPFFGSLSKVFSPEEPLGLPEDSKLGCFRHPDSHPPQISSFPDLIASTVHFSFHSYSNKALHHILLRHVLC